ncbi:ABC transporter ATP-binding protein [Bdellovibrio sp.]|uniref:ABC transporter ATP-binding protein n=1 Tax=Bdellovibrio sp. TaxID=28201 RepID=UPI0032C226DE
MLKIKNLSFSYGDMPVLWDINLEVQQGEIVTIVGSNGAGKSTILKNISGLAENAATGQVEFLGQDITKIPTHERVKRGVIHVPEGRRIFPEMTVLENLNMGTYIAGKKDRQQKIDHAMGLFPKLKERSEQMGGTLSGGEQQMLAIARGLVAQPKILMLDEPSLGLSPLMVKNIFHLIKEINRQGVTILLVEQNVNQSLKISNRAYVLEIGRITLQGTAQELLGSAHVRKAFLGL